MSCEGRRETHADRSCSSYGMKEAKQSDPMWCAKQAKAYVSRMLDGGSRQGRFVVGGWGVTKPGGWRDRFIGSRIPTGACMKGGVSCVNVMMNDQDER